MALTHLEDRAMPEGNPSARGDSAGNSRGNFMVTSLPFAIPEENKSDKLWGAAPKDYTASSDFNLSLKYIANCDMHFFQSFRGASHFLVISIVARYKIFNKDSSVG